MGKILKWYPDTLLARYSGTMHHHAKDFFGRAAAAAAAAAAIPHRSSSTAVGSYELVQLSATAVQSVDIEQ